MTNDRSRPTEREVTAIPARDLRRARLIARSRGAPDKSAAGRCGESKDAGRCVAAPPGGAACAAGAGGATSSSTLMMSDGFAKCREGLTTIEELGRVTSED